MTRPPPGIVDAREPRITASAAATSAGHVSSSTKSLTSANAGTDSNAALPGLGVPCAAREALNAPPAPIASGPNHSSGITTAQPASTPRAPGSRRHNHSPYRPRNGHTSGRSSAAAVPRTTAARERPSSCATTAHTTAAASSPSEFPSAVLNSHHGDSAIVAAAANPAQRPASRSPSAHAPASASSPPARATIKHSAGAMPGTSANGVVNTTGSGFHDGPGLVSSARPRGAGPPPRHAAGA